MKSDSFRQFMALWATGITVVTASGRDGAPLGKAANSFHTVSMSPPLVAWCVDVASTRYEEWMAADAYAVHVLGEGQTDMVSRFAARGGDKFRGVRYASGPYGVPVLEHSHLRLIARVVDRHVAGDHCYLIGEVLEVCEGDEGAPIIFYGGAVSPLHQPTTACEGR